MDGPLDSVNVQDSIESVRSNNDNFVSEAEITGKVLYPSGNTVTIEGATDKNGTFRKAWTLQRPDRQAGPGKIILRVSKGERTSNEFSETFEVMDY